MKHNVIIVTAGNVENYDNEMWFKTYSVKPDDMTPEVFEQMVLERGYELAEEACEYDDFKYSEDKFEGYTEYQGCLYIDSHILVHFYPEDGEIFTRFFDRGVTHEFWTRPEDDDES